ncbi:MAG TPA: ABC transporter permease [Gammaproteobacteria bacterium]
MSLRQTFRALTKTPAFTFAMVLTLAIAMGATTAIFSVVDGVLLKPLPFADADRLVALTHRFEDERARDVPASPALYFTYRDNNEAFESIALWTPGTASITSGEPEEVEVISATFEFLPTLGVTPALGRSFVAAEGDPGAEKTVMLSYGYWQRHFGGAESALGQALVVDGVPRTVIGVLPADFRFTQRPAELLQPMHPNRARVWAGILGENGIARLKAGVSLAAANADVERMIPIYLATFPILPGTTRNDDLHADVQPLKDTFVRDLGDVLAVMTGTIALLLLIACANVANLLLVRTDRRARELAIRAAVGAGWARLVGSLLLESVTLAVTGGVAGLALAAAALPTLLKFAAPNLPTVLEISIDPRVVVFALALSVGAGVLFGMLPAAKYAAPRLGSVLGAAGRSPGVSRERQRARSALVVAQVAIALVLLIGSGLMVRTYAALSAVDPGFTDPEHLQAVGISIPEALEPDFNRVVVLQREILERLAAISGVESAAYVSTLPLDNFAPYFELLIEAESQPVETTDPLRQLRFASPGFFAAFGTPLIAGRTLEWSDNEEGRHAALVSNNLARAEWGSAAAALGKRIRPLPTDPWAEIVGVVGDITSAGLDQAAPQTFYLSQNYGLAQYMTRKVRFVLRSDRVGTAGFIEDVQRAIWSVNASLPLADVQSMGDVYQRSLARTSLTLLLLGITASMALLLGVIGIYAVISYSLAQRTHEIGIRIALGAPSAVLKRLVLGHVALLVGIGVAIGLAGAAALTRLMRTLLFGVGALDPATYAAVSALLVGAALVTAYLPARRAARVDPMDALRAE